MRLTHYIEAAMSLAQIEWIAEEGIHFASIPGLDGVWASAATHDEALIELREVLEEWLLLGLRAGDPLPEIGGWSLDIRREAS